MNNNKEISPTMSVLSERMHNDNPMSFANSKVGNFVMKKCIVCGELKESSEFYKHSKTLDGMHPYCRKCTYKYDVKRKRSKDGIIKRIYSQQIGHSKQRNHHLPKYTLDELKEWVLGQKLFHELYANWVISEYNTYITPSVDRIDDYKGYSFDNIQLMTWKENKIKGYENQKNGITTRQCKAVLQYDLDGRFIKEYYSLSQAQRETGIHTGKISLACRKIYKKTGGYIWEYKTKTTKE